MDAWNAAVAQLVQAEVPPPSRPAYNPRPPGAIQPGSTTHDVLCWLQSRHAGRWWTAAEVIAGVGRHHKTVVWSLVYLRELELVESTKWGATNPRFLRYRARAARGDG